MSNQNDQKTGEAMELNRDALLASMVTFHAHIPMAEDPLNIQKRAEAIAEELLRLEQIEVKKWLAKYNLTLENLEKEGWHLIVSITEKGNRKYSLARQVKGIHLIIHTDVRQGKL